MESVPYVMDMPVTAFCPFRGGCRSSLRGGRFCRWRRAWRARRGGRRRGGSAQGVADEEDDVAALVGREGELTDGEGTGVGDGGAVRGEGDGEWDVARGLNGLEVGAEDEIRRGVAVEFGLEGAENLEVRSTVPAVTLRLVTACALRTSMTRSMSCPWRRRVRSGSAKRTFGAVVWA